MVDIPLKECAEWAVVVLVGWFFALRLLERGVRYINWSFEHLWRSIEVATQGRISTGDGKRAGALLLGKAKSGVGFALNTVADPFIQIGQSFIPQYQTTPVAHATPAPPAPEPSGPTVEEFKAAMDRLGLSPSAPQTSVAKAWGRLRQSENQNEIDAAYAVICAKRNVRAD